MFANYRSQHNSEHLKRKEMSSDREFECFFPMKNAVFWDVTPCGSFKNRRFRGKYLKISSLRASDASYS
jgi:hypothetical protein